MKRAAFRAALGMCAIVALFATTTSPIQAQQPQPETNLFFDTIDVNLVNLEVVVHDKDGNSVTGLTLDDFEIYEDGQRVDLTNFFEVAGRKAVSAPGSPDSSSNTGDDWLPTPQTRRLNLVILIDNFNMRPENRNMVLKKLREHLQTGLDSRDRVMLVTLDSAVRVAQSFTNDVPLLMATLDRLEKEVGRHVQFDMDHRMLLRDMQAAKLPPNPGGALGFGLLAEYESAVMTAETLALDVERLAEVRHQKVRATAEALREFTDSLAGMGGRKAVLYLSDGLATRSADSLTQAWLNKFQFWVMNEGQGARDELRRMEILTGSSDYDLTREFEELTRHAAANQVTFYPISNGGRSIGSSLSAEMGGSSTISGQGPMSQDVASLETLSREASLLEMAAGTGGLAYTRTTNIGGLLDRMVKDFDSFYSLGYARAEHDTDFHDIQVKLVQQDFEVRHLGAFREKDPMGNLEDLTLSALHYDLDDNPLGARLDLGEQVATEKSSYQVPVMLKIPFQNLLLIPNGDIHEGKISVLVIARDDRGGVSPMQRIDVPIQVPNEQMLQAMTGVAAYPLPLELNRGRKHISVGVRDEIGRVDSTLTLRVVVGNIGNADPAGFDLSRGNEGGSGGG